MASFGTVRADDGMVTGRYWFDTGAQTQFIPGAFEIDTKGLPEGLHSLSIFVEAKGVQSSTVSRWFVKTPAVM